MRGCSRAAACQRADAYYAATRAKLALLAGDRAKARALLVQSPVVVFELDQRLSTEHAPRD